MLVGSDDRGTEEDLLDVRVFGQFRENTMPHTAAGPPCEPLVHAVPRAKRLVESKNGAIVRKHLGYSHIPQRCAQEVNAFCSAHLNPYLNFHRPCFLAVDEVDAKGRIRKRCPQHHIVTPFDKLKSLPDTATHLKPGITLQTLEHVASQMSDNQAAQQFNTAREKLFQSICRRSIPAA